MTAPEITRKPSSRMAEKVGEFERILITHPGFPMTPGYGQHGMDLRFALVGELGATQFLMFTDWVPGRVGRPFGEPRRSSGSFPMAADLGYHWKTDPHNGEYDGFGRMDECDFFADGCYYDGSGLRADPVMQRFISDGLDAVWADLEAEYHAIAEWSK